eukprot:TRINITY_DN47278_c0_g1_i1.p1 TRINITY_DN47278_c0_g1~~TRINITY_DN47278_c0_g1_i1.p1  ORF type:complete len:940 (+),score=263.67 TRINITY_DN47278_c0_g1_i1:170-2989(+)
MAVPYAHALRSDAHPLPPALSFVGLEEEADPASLARALVAATALSIELIRATLTGGVIVVEAAASAATGDGFLFKGLSGVGEVLGVGSVTLAFSVSCMAAAFLTVSATRPVPLMGKARAVAPGVFAAFAVFAALAAVELLELLVVAGMGCDAEEVLVTAAAEWRCERAQTLHSLGWPLALLALASRLSVAMVAKRVGGKREANAPVLQRGRFEGRGKVRKGELPSSPAAGMPIMAGSSPRAVEPLAASPGTPAAVPVAIAVATPFEAAGVGSAQLAAFADVPALQDEPAFVWPHTAAARAVSQPGDHAAVASADKGRRRRASVSRGRSRDAKKSSAEGGGIDVCTCGCAFKRDATFCWKCGRRRQQEPEEESSGGTDDSEVVEELELPPLSLASASASSEASSPWKGQLGKRALQGRTVAHCMVLVEQCREKYAELEGELRRGLREQENELRTRLTELCGECRYLKDSLEVQRVHTGAPKPSVEEQHDALIFSVHLQEHAVDYFDETSKEDYCEHVRKRLGCDHVEVASVQAGSVVVETHAVGFVHDEHAAQAAEAVSGGRALDAQRYGRHTVQAPFRTTKLHKASALLQSQRARCAAAAASSSDAAGSGLGGEALAGGPLLLVPSSGEGKASEAAAAAAAAPQVSSLPKLRRRRRRTDVGDSQDAEPVPVWQEEDDDERDAVLTGSVEAAAASVARKVMMSLKMDIVKVRDMADENARVLRLRIDTLTERVDGLHLKGAAVAEVSASPEPKLDPNLRSLKLGLAQALLLSPERQGEAQRLAQKLLTQAFDVALILCADEHSMRQDPQEVHRLRSKYKSTRQLREVCDEVIANKVKQLLATDSGSLASKAIQGALLPPGGTAGLGAVAAGPLDMQLHSAPAAPGMHHHLVAWHGGAAVGQPLPQPAQHLPLPLSPFIATPEGLGRMMPLHHQLMATPPS